MPRNGSGVYFQPAGTAAVSEELISSTAYNNLISDIAAALTGSVPRNGSAGMTNPLKHSDGTVSSPSIAFGTATSTGVYKTIDGFGLAVGGVKIAEVTADGLLNASGVPYAAVVSQELQFIASATTTDIASLPYPNVAITGTTTITSLGDAEQGTIRNIVFLDVLRLTNTGDTIIIPGGSDIITTPRDICTAFYDGDGFCRIIQYQRASGLPISGIGEVKYHASSTVPVGHIECNGAAISRTTYAGLFDAIGITFGAGDGTTTFNIPDDRGYFRRGWDHSAGVDPGRAFGSTQSDDIKAHVHSGGFAIGGYTSGSGVGTQSPGLAANTGSTGGGETRPINRAYLAIIRYA